MITSTPPTWPCGWTSSTSVGGFPGVPNGEEHALLAAVEAAGHPDPAYDPLARAHLGSDPRAGPRRTGRLARTAGRIRDRAAGSPRVMRRIREGNADLSARRSPNRRGAKGCPTVPDGGGELSRLRDDGHPVRADADVADRRLPAAGHHAGRPDHHDRVDPRAVSARPVPRQSAARQPVRPLRRRPVILASTAATIVCYFGIAIALTARTWCCWRRFCCCAGWSRRRSP